MRIDAVGIRVVEPVRPVVDRTELSLESRAGEPRPEIVLSSEREMEQIAPRRSERARDRVTRRLVERPRGQPAVVTQSRPDSAERAAAEIDADCVVVVAVSVAEIASERLPLLGVEHANLVATHRHRDRNGRLV